MRLVPQELGAQTREILGEAGYTEAEITSLESRNIVRATAPTHAEDRS